jgi:hypothetical protein
MPGLPRIGKSAGFFILGQLPAWAKKDPRTCRKRGPFHRVIESLSPLLGYQKIKEIRPSS